MNVWRGIISPYRRDRVRQFHGYRHRFVGPSRDLFDHTGRPFNFYA